MPTTRSSRKGERTGVLDISNHANHGGGKIAPDRSMPPRHGCPFLDLPRELRDHIYGFALVVGVIRVEPVFQEKSSERSCNQNVEEGDSIYDFFIHEYATSRQVAKALLQTCRQVFEESERILYSENTFFFCNDARDPYSILKVNAFFASLPPKAMGWIKSVKIEMGVKNSARNPSWKLYLRPQYQADMVRFRKTFAKCLPALEHVSIVIVGWPDDLCAFAGAGRPIEMSRQDCPNVISPLLLLPKFKRFSMEIRAPDFSVIPCSLVASAALIRSHVLRNGHRLGTANVVVHKRHYAQYVYPLGRPDAAVIRRLPGKRVSVVRCDDDETGKSFLKAAQRLSPLWVNKDHWKDLLGYQLDPRQQLYRGFTTASNIWDQPLPDPQMDVLDYAQSDDGDNDSLNELDLSDQNVEPVALPDKVITLMEETLDGNIGGWN
ncbi:hypothetical protein HDK64DRAFT_255356 [Phyllosticta capitalensis]